MYLYIGNYVCNLFNKEILSLWKFKSVQLESFYLFFQKILIFSFFNIDQLNYEKISFIKYLLRVCIAAITNVFLQKDNLFDIDGILDLNYRIVIYQVNLKEFFLLQK